MKLTTPIAIVLGAALIAAAVTVHGLRHRYQIASASSPEGFFVRLDTFSGAAEVCILQPNDDEQRYVVPCTGKRELARASSCCSPRAGART